MPTIITVVTVVGITTTAVALYKFLNKTNDALNTGKNIQEYKKLLRAEKEKGFPDPDYAQDLKDAIDKAQQEGIKESSEAAEESLDLICP